VQPAIVDGNNTLQAGRTPTHAYVVMELLDHDLRFFTSYHKLSYMQLM
jgi:hypothetical protein